MTLKEAYRWVNVFEGIPMCIDGCDLRWAPSYVKQTPVNEFVMSGIDLDTGYDTHYKFEDVSRMKPDEIVFYYDILKMTE